MTLDNGNQYRALVRPASCRTVVLIINTTRLGGSVPFPEPGSEWNPLPDCGKLDTATLGRTAAVMRHGSHVLDHGDLDAQCVQRTNSGFTTRAGALDAHFQILHTIFHRGAARCFSSNLRCKRGRFARTLEAGATGRCPRQRIALAVGDGDDGVVEGSVYVSDAFSNVFLYFLPHARCCGSIRGFCHNIFLKSVYSGLFLQRLRCLARTLAGAGVGAGTLTANRQALAMTQTAIAAEVHQALDAHRYFTAQIAFDDELAHFVTELFE